MNKNVKPVELVSVKDLRFDILAFQKAYDKHIKQLFPHMPRWAVA